MLAPLSRGLRGRVRRARPKLDGGRLPLRPCGDDAAAEHCGPATRKGPEARRRLDAEEQPDTSEPHSVVSDMPLPDPEQAIADPMPGAPSPGSRGTNPPGGCGASGAT